MGFVKSLEAERFAPYQLRVPRPMKDSARGDGFGLWVMGYGQV